MSRPKLLYLVGHDILEYNHLKLFYELGFDAMSVSKYFVPDAVEEEHLPQLHVEYGPMVDIMDEFQSLQDQGWYEYGKHHLNLTKEFVDQFDVVFTSWIIEPIEEYWDILKDKLVVYETLGQSDGGREMKLKRLREQGLKVIRMPAGEENFPGYCGGDDFIDLDVDTDYYQGWKGTDKHVFTINSAFTQRSHVCNGMTYMQITDQFPRKLYGSHNEALAKSRDFCHGTATREELLEQYQRNMVYFSLGTRPCPIVLSFKEAMSVGIPTITWGPKLGGSTFRAHTHIENGVNGFYSDDPHELSNMIHELLGDKLLRETMSFQARHTALLKFSTHIIKPQWKNFFDQQGITLDG